MIQYSYRNYKLILPKFARIVLCTYICVPIDISHCGLQIDSVSKLSFCASNKPAKKKEKKRKKKPGESKRRLRTSQSSKAVSRNFQHTPCRYLSTFPRIPFSLKWKEEMLLQLRSFWLLCARNFHLFSLYLLRQMSLDTNVDETAWTLSVE